MFNIENVTTLGFDDTVYSDRDNSITVYFIHQWNTELKTYESMYLIYDYDSGVEGPIKEVETWKEVVDFLTTYAPTAE